MNSLSELNQFFQSNSVAVKQFNGWNLIVGKDTWTMAHDVLYCNKQPYNKKDLKNYLEKVQKNVNKSTQTRKWRGISSRHYK
jgi:hypothetical protein